tara:strand:- start:333 stop:554 length:222 start_codon:yes stop_codon:yes gene_type:complete
MPKRKATQQPRRDRTIYNKDEIMVESVFLILQYNLYRKTASNDMTLIEYAKKLDVEELRQFNSKLKEILSQTK